jgi:SpoIID/LytB domain protein
MSQYGARGLAEQGHDFKEILNHYYPGAELRCIYAP